MAFQRIQSGDRDLNLVQDNVNKALSPIQASPLVGGNVINNVTLVGGATTLIKHGLTHIPTVIVTGVPNVSTSIWQNAPATITQVSLTCTTTCVVSVLVN